MSWTKTILPDEFHRLLNLLGDSTGDYYLYYDYQSGLVHLSANVMEEYDVFSEGVPCCTLAQWHQAVDPRDLKQLERCYHELFSGQQDTYNLNYRVQTRTGQTVWINSRGKCHRTPDGTPDYVLGRLSDTASTSKADPFTGTLSIEALKYETGELLASGLDGFLLLIGVDDLKSINIKHGRAFGDSVIRTLAEAMGDEAPAARSIFRVNGDCFAINLPSVSQPEVEALFSRLQARIQGLCTVSGGCVSYTQYQVPDGATLLQYAELSLDASKLHGKNRLSFFAPEDYEKRLVELELREDLEQSVKSGFSGFSLCYQPQIRSESYQLYGAEALLRYQSPRRGAVSPLEFVPILEQTELIYPVGLWVIREALAQCRRWREHLPEFHMSINMSYRQLQHDSIEYDVISLLQESLLPGSALTIELTESMQLLEYPHLNSIFRIWKKHGIEISVDDFGTGYSSLGRLKEMEIDEIKIDRCFVNNIQKSAYNYRLLSNMMELAESSHIRVCCEGVETQEELAVLEELHPALFHGFLFSRPCTPAELEARYLDASSPAYQTRQQQEASFRRQRLPAPTQSMQVPENELVSTILEAEDDIFYLSDIDTHELYYLNPAGQKMFGVRDYQGRKCYKVLHGVDAPCSFCTNQLLRRDSFHVWENHNDYCGRHFLLKDKLVSYRGRNVRLEVALDITKQEFVSQTAQERLSFAEKIVGYMETLTEHTNYSEAVNQVLASVGDFYQADRAYLFERDPVHPGYWNNTFEWCAPMVPPQQHSLQHVPPEVTSRWMELFEKNQPILMLNPAPLRKVAPLEWQVLQRQGIQRLIAVPIRDAGQVIGFLGVDNPRYAISDVSQVRVLSSFLLTRIRQDRDERRYQELLRESNQDILLGLNVGFWIIRISKHDGRREMIANDVTYRLLGIQNCPSPEECYHYWYSRIDPNSQDLVNNAVTQMGRSNQIMQIEYLWHHPDAGTIRLRFSGMQIGETADWYHCKGYCRRLTPNC